MNFSSFDWTESALCWDVGCSTASFAAEFCAGLAGPFSFLVSTKRLDSQTSQWLGELKEACEKGGNHAHKP